MRLWNWWACILGKTGILTKPLMIFEADRDLKTFSTAEVMDHVEADLVFVSLTVNCAVVERTELNCRLQH